jgi:AcrR family transcriptional regulator
MLADDFMGGSGMDRRSRKTRGALHRALISLILSRGYDEITVSDIADAANVGRSTFYLHYTDKDDLLRAGLNALKLVLEDPPDEFREDAHEPLRFSRFLTEHLFEQHHLYRTMMASRGGAIVIDSIRQAICEILRSELKAEDSSPPDEVLVQFIAGAYLAVMTWWLDRGRRAAPEEINARFMHLARGSLAVAQAGV